MHAYQIRNIHITMKLIGKLNHATKRVKMTVPIAQTTDFFQEESKKVRNKPSSKQNKHTRRNFSQKTQRKMGRIPHREARFHPWWPPCRCEKQGRPSSPLRLKMLPPTWRRRRGKLTPRADHRQRRHDDPSPSCSHLYPKISTWALLGSDGVGRPNWRASRNDERKILQDRIAFMRSVTCICRWMSPLPLHPPFIVSCDRMSLRFILEWLGVICGVQRCVGGSWRANRNRNRMI